MTQPWHMSRVRSKQPVRRYKPCAPVGDDANNYLSWGSRNVEPVQRNTPAGRSADFSCGGCGYLRCSCERQRKAFEHRVRVAEALMKVVDPAERAAAVDLLLTGKMPQNLPAPKPIAAPSPHEELRRVQRDEAQHRRYIAHCQEMQRANEQLPESQRLPYLNYPTFNDWKQRERERIQAYAVNMPKEGP